MLFADVDDENYVGRLVKFRFVSVSTFLNGSITLGQEKLKQLTTALKLHSPNGVILQSKEKTGKIILKFNFGLDF